ncbi:MAG: sugar phosphate isomerase/epimerase [Oligoflexia bacterium]|nr:sugar phosphate isomerase/epimerase [Oligoflexia bacterium]
MKIKNFYQFGIVQGRLIQSPPGCLQWFPQDFWESEFFLASSIGFGFVELIAETYHNEKNPLWRNEGIDKINALVKKNNLIIPTLCNDFIVKNPFTKQEVVDQNITLLQRGKLLGISKYIMPFFEVSELRADNYELYKDGLITVADAAKELGIEVTIETILNGKELITFLEKINHSNIRCVFDTGNRIAYGHNIYSDIIDLGNAISHFHIKDKNQQNENVLLGTGLVDFMRVFKSLNAINYQGLLTFETTRGKNPIDTAKMHKQYIEFFINETSK